MSSYFWKPATGINADLRRHTKEIHRIKEKLATIDPDKSPMDNAMWATYFSFLCQCEYSRALVAMKIGRKRHVHT